MTKAEMTAHWAQDIIPAVFAAEEAISKDWHQRLVDAQTKPKSERQELYGEYCRAIAEEILSRTPDSEFEE